MPGVKALRKIQLGDESSAGTPVAASTIWRGMGTISDQREVVHVEEDVGYLSGTDRTYVPKLFAELELEETEATFEQLPHILEMSLKDETPAQDGTGSGYIYQYEFPTTTQPTIQTYTIEGGDDQQAEEMVIYRQFEDFLIPSVQRNRVVVLHILNDINVHVANGSQDFGFVFPVGKTGELHRNAEAGGTELVDGQG